MKHTLRIPWETPYGYTEIEIDTQVDGEMGEEMYAHLVTQVALQEQAYIAIIGDFRPFRGGLSGAAHEAGLAPAPARTASTYASAPAGVPAMPPPQVQDGQASQVCPACGFPGKSVAKPWGDVLECTNPVAHGKPRNNGGYWPATIR